jgi:hypothetical protein
LVREEEKQEQEQEDDCDEGKSIVVFKTAYLELYNTGRDGKLNVTGKYVKTGKEAVINNIYEGHFAW